MQQETIECPSCKHENPGQARFCEQCGASLEAPEPAERLCPKCGEANNPQARFCQACGEPLATTEAKPGEESVAVEKPASKPEKKVRRRLPTWARILLTTLVVVIIAAALGVGFAYASPYINAYMTYSPARMERAGVLAREFVERVYPAFADSEPDVWVETIDGQDVYVVDFLVQDGDNSLGLRVLVNKAITAARALEYVELGPPEPYDGGLAIDGGDGEQIQLVLSEGIEEILQAPQIVLVDDYSSLDEARWSTSAGVEASDSGEVVLTGSSPFSTNLADRSAFSGGEGFIASLMLSEEAEFEIALDSGEWETSGFRRAGLYYMGGQLSTNIWYGADRVDQQYLDALDLAAGRRYGVLGAVDGEGSLLLMIWDEENPSQVAALQKEFGEDAAGLSWSMHLAVDSGSVTVDDYYRIAFSGFR
jgi:hypothetical protein